MPRKWSAVALALLVVLAPHQVRADLSSEDTRLLTDIISDILGTLANPPKKEERQKKELESQQIDPSGWSLEKCMSALRDKDPAVRASAANALARYGPAAAPAVPDLVKLLSDTSPNVRVSVPLTLAKIGPAARDALPALALALRDEDRAVRGRSATAIGAQGDAAKSYVPALRAALEKETYSSKAGMAAAIWRITGESGEMLPILRSLLTDDDVMVRATAALALARVGPTAKEAEPYLAKAIADEDAAVRAASAFALSSIGGAKPEVLATVENECLKAFADLGERLASGKTHSREWSSLQSPGSTKAEGVTAAQTPEKEKPVAFSGKVYYEASDDDQAYGVKGGEVGEIAFVVATNSSGPADVKGKIIFTIEEKPYYAGSPIAHKFSAEFSGTVSASADGTRQCAARAPCVENVTGAVAYESRCELLIQIQMSPDKAYTGTVGGMLGWADCRFAASAK